MNKKINGILVVDKPNGITSLDVVRFIKHRFHVKKAGHIGTLDPFATGVLPVVLNEGTKLVPFLNESPKEYEVTLKLGEETLTDDFTGEVVFRGSWGGVSEEKIEEILQTFVGKIHQIPPMFSAIKLQGKPLYQWARKGIEVNRKAREVEIYQIQTQRIAPPLIFFKVSCSKGTYIRTLGREIGRKIGCGGHLLCLRRIRSGSFTLDQAIPWEKIKELARPDGINPWVISLEDALTGLPKVIGDERMIKNVQSGREMKVQDFPSKDFPVFKKGQWLKMLSQEEKLIAILTSELKEGDIPLENPQTVVFRPIRIFHPSSF